MTNTSELSPVLYLPHGAGPLPLLGDKNHQGLIHFFKNIANDLGSPKAILVVSAHWEEEQITIGSAERPDMIYDYYGFADEAYSVNYPAPGSPGLASKIANTLLDLGVKVKLDHQRGFDHGLYVPLKLMFPDATIPCVQISLLKNLNPEDHIALGKSLADLRTQGVVIIGSGMSFHNMTALRSHNSEDKASIEFDNWLQEVCTSHELSVGEKEYMLNEWKQAPAALYCHPREEHLLPLHVCFGAASIATPNASSAFNEMFLGKLVSGFIWK